MLNDRLKNLCHFVSQTEVKPKSIMTYSHMLKILVLFISYMHILALSCDWFTGMSVSFEISQSDGFGFTALN